LTRKTPRGRGFLGGAPVIALGALGAVDVQAQAVAADQIPDGGLEEIVVTATKREAIAQDLGMSLAVISGADLETQRILTTSDLSSVVPDLVVVDGGAGFNLIEIRGVADIATSIQTAPTVGVYVDEYSVAVSGGGVPEIALFDASRVEVLRGPQGTLFGDGSLSGTVRVVSNAPDATKFYGRAQGEVSATEEGGTNYTIRGVVNVPLVDDRLALRVAAGYRDNSGWYDNPLQYQDTGLAFLCGGAYPCAAGPQPIDPIPNSDVKDRTDTNDEQDTEVRATLGWEISSAFSADLSYFYSKSDVDDSYSGVERDHKDTFINEPADSEFDIAGLTLTYDFGPAQLTSATSYFTQSTWRITDSTRFAMPLNALVFGRLISSGWTDTSTDYDAFTEELRLASTGDHRFDWTAGAFFRDENRDLEFAADGTPDAGFDILNDFFRLQSTSYALFGEAGFDFTDHLQLVAGLRYFETDQSSRFKLWGALVAPWTTPELAPLMKLDDSDDNLSYRVVLNWRPTDNVLLYANASSGFRAGGVNPTAALIAIIDAPATVNETFDAETMDNYELGAKTMLLDDRLQLNLYLFEMNWQDVQVSAIDGSGLVDYIFNAGDARSRGLEVEWRALLTDAFELSGGVAFLDAEYLDTTSTPFANSVVTKGNSMPRSPDLQLDLTGAYRMPLGQDWTGSVVATLSYESETYSDAANTPALENDAATVVNLRLGAERDMFSIVLFADNLTDEEQTFSSRIADVGLITGTGSVRRNYLRPRTIGVELGVSF
jgi:outer membrane receptor protein involved in Fe transport